MDPNRPNNNHPDPNHVKSSSVPNVPTPTGTFYDLRGSTVTSIGRDMVTHNHSGGAPYHIGHIYQQPQLHPFFHPTRYPNPNTNSMPQSSGYSSSKGGQYSAYQPPPTYSPTSPGCASPTTTPMAPWSGNTLSAATQPIPSTTPTTSAGTTLGAPPPSANIVSEPSTSDDTMNINVPEKTSG